MTFGSLFAGIGGFDLGLERAGMQCKWQVENNEYCQKVLEKNWPKVARYSDVRTFPPSHDDYGVHLICGGFPCQDISNCGRKEGLKGSRSGLWAQYIRIVRTLVPRFVLVENVAALLGRGIGTVLGDLSEAGYDAEWFCLQASAFGFLHQRERTFILAYRHSIGLQTYSNQTTICAEAACRWNDGYRQSVGSAPRLYDSSELDSMLVSSFVMGAFDGIPNRNDRIKACGNAVVPDIAEWIGRRILEAEKEKGKA